MDSGLGKVLHRRIRDRGTCREVLGTDDGLAKFPSIRESRRIRAEFTVFEQDVCEEAPNLEYTPKNRRDHILFNPIKQKNYIIFVSVNIGKVV